MIAALATTVTALWKMNETKNAKAIADQQQTIVQLTHRSQECEADRSQLNIRLAVLEDRMAIEEE